MNILAAEDTLWNKPYTHTADTPLHENFDYFSETEPLECNSITSPTSCIFKAKTDAHLGSIIFILIVTFLLMVGFIGYNPDHCDPYGIGDCLDKTAKDKINQKPLQLGKAIVVFVIALLLIKHIRNDLVDKYFNFSTHTLSFKKAGTDKVTKQIQFQDIAYFELMKYDASPYQHYEVNVKLKNGNRIHLYATKDKILSTGAAATLSHDTGISVQKVSFIDPKIIKD